MEIIAFTVDETPYACWDWDLSKKNLEFLEGIDSEYFRYVAEAHAEHLEGELQMSKPVLNEDGFIEKCNEELRKHPDYEPGMEFIPAPKDSSGTAMRGYDWVDPKNRTGIFAQIANKVKEEYDVHVTLHNGSTVKI